MIIIYAKDGDNPSSFEVDAYRAEIKANPTKNRTISSMLALNCIRAEMKLGSIPLETAYLIFKDTKGNKVKCKFIQTDSTVQWVTLDWKGTCADLHKHMPQAKEMEVDLDLLMEIM